MVQDAILKECIISREIGRQDRAFDVEAESAAKANANEARTEKSSSSRMKPTETVARPREEVIGEEIDMSESMQVKKRRLNQLIRACRTGGGSPTAYEEHRDGMQAEILRNVIDSIDRKRKCCEPLKKVSELLSVVVEHMEEVPSEVAESGEEVGVAVRSEANQEAGAAAAA